MRRRLYLMRHGAVSYFEGGRPIRPDDVPLTVEGRAQARAVGQLLEDVRLDRVITSGLVRTVETAALAAPGIEPETWSELEEIKGSTLSSIPPGELEEVFVHAFRGIVPLERRFLGGETIGALLDRVLPAVERLVADPGWDTALVVGHGGVNRAILSYALTGERVFFGHFEQAAGCVNVLDIGDEWIVRAVNVAPTDLAHAATRQTTMEAYWAEWQPGDG